MAQETSKQESQAPLATLTIDNQEDQGYQTPNTIQSSQELCCQSPETASKHIIWVGLHYS